METPQLDISEEDLAKAKDALRVLSSLLPEGDSRAGVSRPRTSAVGGPSTSSGAGPSSSGQGSQPLINYN